MNDTEAKSPDVKGLHDCGPAELAYRMGIAASKGLVEPTVALERVRSIDEAVVTTTPGIVERVRASLDKSAARLPELRSVLISGEIA